MGTVRASTLELQTTACEVDVTRSRSHSLYINELEDLCTHSNISEGSHIALETHRRLPWPEPQGEPGYVPGDCERVRARDIEDLDRREAPVGVDPRYAELVVVADLPNRGLYVFVRASSG